MRKIGLPTLGTVDNILVLLTYKLQYAFRTWWWTFTVTYSIPTVIPHTCVYLVRHNTNKKRFNIRTRCKADFNYIDLERIDESYMFQATRMLYLLTVDQLYSNLCQVLETENTVLVRDVLWFTVYNDNVYQMASGSWQTRLRDQWQWTKCYNTMVDSMNWNNAQINYKRKQMNFRNKIVFWKNALRYETRFLNKKWVYVTENVLSRLNHNTSSTRSCAVFTHKKLR